MLSGRYKKPLNILWSALLILILIVPAFYIIFPTEVQAWSAVSAVAATHQYILEEAYKLLQADPAFDAKVFPSLNQILASDGVSIIGLGGIASGPGPDVDPKSPYSDHYYNPRPGIADSLRGGGPDAVRREYEKLLQAMDTNNSANAAHAAGWAAHFLSDIETPYHVNGTTMLEIDRIYKEQIPRNSLPERQLFLDEKITGPRTQGHATLGSKESNPTFRAEAESFLKAATTAEKNWFDPWYWNGVDYKTSSHVIWEGMINPTRYTLRGYSPDWKNPAATSSTNSARLAQARAFAVATAQDGLANQIANENDYGKKAVEKSVQRVYTLWRSSITALKPSFQAQIIDKQKLKYKITAKVINAADEDATNVEITLKLGANGSFVDNVLPTQKIKLLPGKGSAETYWQVQFSKSGDNSVALDVVASYTNTPDRQNALSQSILVVPSPTPTTTSKTPVNSSGINHSIVFLIDCSDSMRGQKLSDVKIAAIRTLNSVPASGVELSVGFFGGFGVSLAPGFVQDKVKISEMINAIQAGGDTPLAQAITQAGQMINNRSNGNSATIVLLSDGEDTCGGNPAEAVRGLNPDTKIKSHFRLPFESVIEAAGSKPINLQVIGFALDSFLAEQTLMYMAVLGNGEYYPAANAGELGTALSKAVNGGMAIAAAAAPAKPGSTSNPLSDLVSGWHIQAWWFIALAAILLFVVILLTRLGRRKPEPSITHVGVSAGVGAQPPLQSRASSQTTVSPINRPQPPGSSAHSVPFCPNCRSWGAIGSLFCITCGSALSLAGQGATAQVTTSQTFCPKCGFPGSLTAAFCSNCGGNLRAASFTYCPQCGTPNQIGSIFCNKCGGHLAAQVEIPTNLGIPLHIQQPAPARVTATVSKAVGSASGAWWLLAIFFLLPGGLISWIAVKNKNPNMARRMLMLSLTLTMLIVVTIVLNWVNYRNTF